MNERHDDEKTDLPLKYIYYFFATLLNLSKKGYFIPYRYASENYQGLGPYSWLESRFYDEWCPTFSQTLANVAMYKDELEQIGGTPPEPRWKQDWFPGLDGAVAYTIIRSYRPGRLVEVGSGHSTRFIKRAVADEGLSTRITCIDPEPRADISGLGIELRRETVQRTAPDVFEALESGDMLVVDSSHLALEGSDVDWIINRAMPKLPAGVLVHFHDIFLPDPYPVHWHWRGYNEQTVVAALIAGGRARPIFSSQFVRTRMASEVEKAGLGWIPLVPGAIESSLWLVLN